MRLDRPIRLPLQTGTSCLWSLARAAAMLVPGFIGIWYAFDVDLFESPFLNSFLVHFARVAASVLFFLYGLGALGSAWRERPSDIVFASDGFTIEGGAQHALSVPWAKIDRARIALAEKDTERLTLPMILTIAVLYAPMIMFLTILGVVPFLRRFIDPMASALGRLARAFRKETALSLTVGMVGEQHQRKRKRQRKSHQHGPEPALLVAEAVRPVERESVEAIFESLRAPEWYRARATVEHVPLRAVVVVKCAECDAPVVPVDRSATPCRFCGASVPLPEELRLRVRAAGEVPANRRRSESLLSQLLSQPRASGVAARLHLGAWAMMTVWPVAVFLFFRRLSRHTLEARSGVALAVFAGGALLGLFFLLRALLADRCALRLITLTMGAVSSPEPDGPHSCRLCGAPLAAPVGESIVATCVYCHADSILGLDLHRELLPGAVEVESLEEAFSHRQAERSLRAALLVLAGIALAAAGTQLAWLVMRH